MVDNWLRGSDNEFSSHILVGTTTLCWALRLSRNYVIFYPKQNAFHLLRRLFMHVRTRFVFALLYKGRRSIRRICWLRLVGLWWATQSRSLWSYNHLVLHPHELAGPAPSHNSAHVSCSIALWGTFVVSQAKDVNSLHQPTVNTSLKKNTSRNCSNWQQLSIKVIMHLHLNTNLAMIGHTISNMIIHIHSKLIWHAEFS